MRKTTEGSPRPRPSHLLLHIFPYHFLIRRPVRRSPPRFLSPFPSPSGVERWAKLCGGSPVSHRGGEAVGESRNETPEITNPREKQLAYSPPPTVRPLFSPFMHCARVNLRASLYSRLSSTVPLQYISLPPRKVPARAGSWVTGAFIL